MGPIQAQVSLEKGGKGRFDTHRAEAHMKMEETPMLGTENIQRSKKIHRDLRGFWKFLCRSIENPIGRCGTKMI